MADLIIAISFLYLESYILFDLLASSKLALHVLPFPRPFLIGDREAHRLQFRGNFLSEIRSPARAQRGSTCLGLKRVVKSCEMVKHNKLGTMYLT